MVVGLTIRGCSGGNWNNGVDCGSRSRSANEGVGTLDASLGGHERIWGGVYPQTTELATLRQGKTRYFKKSPVSRFPERGGLFLEKEPPKKNKDSTRKTSDNKGAIPFVTSQALARYLWMA